MIKGLLIKALPLVVFTFSVHAQQMSDNSRDLLIDKLEKINAGLSANDESKTSITLRLADLYAEKGRMAAMRELEQDCLNCVAGTQERAKALKYYNEVLAKLGPESKGAVLVQMGHLYELTGDEPKAVIFYNRIIKESNKPESIAEANLSLAEIYYKQRDFARAKTYYEQVEKSPRANHSLAAYRKAWCSFNMGAIDQSVKEIVAVLKNPKLLSRSSNPEAPVDVQFHEEASRDFATFLSKTTATKADVENLYNLSPETTRVPNVMSLAFEAERLGRKQEALDVWTFVYPNIKGAEDRWNAQVSMALMQFDLGDRKTALKTYADAMASAKTLKTCESTDCKETRRRARQIVVSWNQLEKLQPSLELLTAYEYYLSAYPEDADMSIYAAEVARKHEKYADAARFYAQAQTELAKDPKQSKKLETVLLTHLEVGELSKDEALMTKAYDDYLTLSQEKTKAFEVRYQKARNQYEKGEYAPAADGLKVLALETTGDAKIRKQAADLSLDALVLLKDEVKLGAWAAEYSKAFPEAAGAEFGQMAQKSVLTQAANLAEKDAQGSFAALTAFNVEQAAPSDKIIYYKNKVILAEKLKLYSEAQIAATELLKQPTLSAEDKEFAWARKAYMAEMTLDFATAMTATENLETTLTADEKALKIALFAELSGKASAPYYAQYLKVAKDEDAKILVATELVRKAEDQEKAIEAYKSYLQKKPALLAQLYVEAYTKKPTDSIVKKVTGDAQLKTTDSGKLLGRVVFLREFETLQKGLVAHQLDASNDRKLVASIKGRGNQLKKLEGMAQKAITQQDWTSQLVSLDLLAKESDRFYQELMTAPMPEGLSSEEEGQYLALLSAQAAPYQAKATEAKAKVEEFWAQSNWQTALKDSWKQKDFRSLIAVEVEALKAIAPEKHQAPIAGVMVEDAAVTAQVKPSAQELEAARLKVNKDPMSRSALEELLKVEAKADNKPMVQYLQTRIETLEKNKSVN